MMTKEEMFLKAPAIFATAPVEKASDRYTFIPTTRVINDIENIEIKGENGGWYVERVNQQSSKEKYHTKHEVVFRSTCHPAVNGVFPEIRLINSHNRLSSFNFYVGLYRLVCSNGLVVAEKIFESLNIRHIAYNLDELIELIDSIVVNIENIFVWVHNMEETLLTRDEQINFAVRAIAIRYKEYVNKDGVVDVKAIHKAIDVESFLQAYREDDDNYSLWSVYNVIQEKLIKGGFQRIGTKDNVSKPVRPITNIKLDINVNKSLWQLANNYID